MSRTQRPNRKSPKGCQSGPHSVEAWGVRFGEPKLDNDVWDVYHPGMLERCEQDVRIQRQIFDVLLKEGAGEGWRNAHMINMKLFYWLQRQEEYGWTVDKEVLDKGISTLERWIDKVDRATREHIPLTTEIQETKSKGKYNYVKKPFKKDGSYAEVSRRFVQGIGFDPDGDYINCISGPFSRVDFRKVDLNSNKEVKDFLLASGWIPDEWNYNDKGEKTSAKLSKNDSFRGIRGGLGKLIAKRVQCRHRLSSLEGWRSAIRVDGRLPALVGGIASTGRLRHNLIVNVPSPAANAFFAKTMRRVFRAKHGWVQVGIDSKGNQVRQLAARMGDRDFTAAALKDKDRDGTDFHEYNRELCGGITRTRAKNFFYGLIFGGQPPTIARQIDSTVDEAKRLIDLYMNNLSKYAELKSSLEKEWTDNAKKYWDAKYNRMTVRDGYITGLDGRPIYIDSKHKILCYALQSDEAIQMAYAYVHTHEELIRQGYKYIEQWGSNIWMHDEMQFESIPEIADDVASIGCESIAWAGRELNIACPHEGDSKIGENWYDTH